MFTLALLIITTFLLPLYLAPAQIVQAARIPQGQVQLAPDLTLTYTGNVTVTTFHGLITYQATIHNHSQMTATDFALMTLLPLPGETTFLTNTLTTSNGKAIYDAKQHMIYWNGALSAQESVRIIFTIQLTKFMTCKTIYSYALLEAPSLPVALSATAQVEYRCPQIKALQFTISASVTQTTPGSTIDYRLTLTNSSDLPTDKLKIENSLPFGTGYVTDSAIATRDIITYNPTFKELRWAGVLPELSTVQLSFQARIRDRVQCGTILNNQATVYNTGFMQPSNPTIQAQTTVTCTENQPWSDFGDAPDSDSNHHSMNNTAYPEIDVLGRFPTVWEGTPPHEASGPTHHLGHFWLGDGVNAEVDADLNLNYQDFIYGYDFTNILHNGKEDVANLDDDDGWRNPQVPLLNCETPTLIVRIRRSDLPITIERLWLNVWFDGNRDGDWQDSGDCSGLIEPLQVKSFEWVIQDWIIDANQLSVNNYLDLKIPTKRIYNPTPSLPVWLRFTLSEQPALRPSVGALADGRGVAYPALFQVGETEDYRIDGLPQGEPISVTISHDIDAAPDDVIRLNNKIRLFTTLEANAGIAPATITMNHALPAELALVSQPELNLFFGPDIPSDSITPLVATFRPDAGPSGSIEWRGQMIRGTGMVIAYEAIVKACPPSDEKGQPSLHSVAQLRQPDGTLVNAEITHVIDCTAGDERLFLPLVNK